MDFATGKAGDALPGITGHGSEVQLVLCLEDQCLGPKLQDGEQLEGSCDGEESKWEPVQRPLLLPEKEFQAPTEIQGLRGD